MNDTVKAAKYQAQAYETKAALEFTKEIISNPVVELLLAAFVIEQMSKAGYFNDVFVGGLEKGGLMAIIGGAVGAQQLAPLAPYIAQGSEGLLKALPGLLALGAAA